MSHKSWLAALMFLMVPLLNYTQAADRFAQPCPSETPLISDQMLSQKLNLMVSSIDVCGVTSEKIDTASILELTTPYEGRSVSSAELQELRAELTNLYIQRGFVTSGVILPDQSISGEISGETILYKAIEGKLSRIVIDGSAKISDRYIQTRLERHIEEPVSIDDIRYALVYLQNDPNIDRLDARLNPGDLPGQSILLIQVDEPPRFSLVGSFNNHRSTSTGEEEGSLSFGLRNLTGNGEVMNFSSGVTDGADNESVRLTLPISRRNTSLQIYAIDSDSSIIEARLQSLDIESLTETRAIKLSHPFIDSINQTLSLSLGYETRNSETTLGGLPFSLSPGAQDGVAETNAAIFGIDWTRRNENYVLAARLNFRHGDDYQGATIFKPPKDPKDMLERPFNPTGADGQFDLVQTQVLYRRLVGPGQFEMRFTGQFSDDPLMSIEKIAIGGFNTVRGYPENFLVRDNGVAVSLEYQMPLFGAIASPGVRNLTIVPFLDYGQSWDKINKNTTDTFRDTSGINAIGSLGAGLLWRPIEGFRAELFWGADIYDYLQSDQDPRDFRDSSTQDKGIHFALSYSIGW